MRLQPCWGRERRQKGNLLKLKKDPQCHLHPQYKCWSRLYWIWIPDIFLWHMLRQSQPPCIYFNQKTWIKADRPNFHFVIDSTMGSMAKIEKLRTAILTWVWDYGCEDSGQGKGTGTNQALLWWWNWYEWMVDKYEVFHGRGMVWYGLPWLWLTFPSKLRRLAPDWRTGISATARLPTLLQ